MIPVDYSIGVLPWVALLMGLAVGIAAVLWMRRGNGEDLARGDVELLRDDLQAQHDEVLERLRGDSLENLSDDDRRQLERRAARTLQRLDELPAPSSQPAPVGPGNAAPRGFWAARPALAGALLGGGFVGLSAVLVALAVRDAQPTPTQPEAPFAAAPEASGPPAAQAQPPLPPFLAQQVEQFRSQLEADPSDVDTRRQLAITLLSGQQLFEAFQEANLILQQEPEDPEALYITGFVRYVMGQPAEAVAQLDRAIAAAPSYAQPWLVKGLIQLQLEDRAAAIDTWERGLEAVGSDNRMEHLIREARTDKTVAEILASAPPG